MGVRKPAASRVLLPDFSRRRRPRFVVVRIHRYFKRVLFMVRTVGCARMRK